MRAGRIAEGAGALMEKGNGWINPFEMAAENIVKVWKG